MTGQRRNYGRWLKRRLPLLLGAVVVATLACYSQFARVERENFMGDESGWIAASGYYTQLVFEGDFTRRSWDGEHLSNWGSINPPLGKLMLGLGIRLHPDYEPRDSAFRGIYQFSSSWEWNARAGNIPFESTVIRARQVTAVWYSAALVLLYLAVAVHTNVISGVCSILIILTNSWVVRETTPVLTDPYYFVFVFLLVLLGGRLTHAESLRSKLMWYGLAGAIGGLACSVKINGLPFATILVATLMAYRWTVHRSVGWKDDALALCTFGVGGLLVVYVLNPWFWPTDSWRSVLEYPRLYGRWSELFEVQRMQTPWPESGRVLEIFRVLLGLFTIYIVEFVFLGSGVAFLTIRIFRSIAARKTDPVVVPAVFLVVNIVFLVMLMPVNYRRYYLLAVFSVKVIEGIGVSYFAMAGTRWIWVRAKRIRSGIHARRGGTIRADAS